jgi:hypothetical protein
MVEEYGESWKDQPFNEAQMQVFLDLYGARKHGRIPALHSLVTDEDIEMSQSSRSSVNSKATARAPVPGYVRQEDFDKLQSEFVKQQKMLMKLASKVFGEGGEDDDSEDDEDGEDSDDSNDGEDGGDDDGDDDGIAE